jgi:hypothetical protein
MNNIHFFTLAGGYISGLAITLTYLMPMTTHRKAHQEIFDN